MAQERKVIKSVEEATCENCIYSLKGNIVPNLWCRHNDVERAVADDSFCNLGRWLANDRDDKMIFAHALNDIYYIFQGGTHE